jgi:hypothetical protein
MQMSRSVIMPMTFRPSFITGKTPQSFSHINFAASAKLPVSQMAVASGVIISFTSIIKSPPAENPRPPAPPAFRNTTLRQAATNMPLNTEKILR